MLYLLLVVLATSLVLAAVGLFAPGRAVPFRESTTRPQAFAIWLVPATACLFLLRPYLAPTDNEIVADFCAYYLEFQAQERQAAFDFGADPSLSLRVGEVIEVGGRTTFLLPDDKHTTLEVGHSIKITARDYSEGKLVYLVDGPQGLAGKVRPNDIGNWLFTPDRKDAHKAGLAAYVDDVTAELKSDFHKETGVEFMDMLLDGAMYDCEDEDESLLDGH